MAEEERKTRANTPEMVVDGGKGTEKLHTKQQGVISYVACQVRPTSTSCDHLRRVNGRMGEADIAIFDSRQKHYRHVHTSPLDGTQ